jgi:mono/diheme cytochrome c family protein
MLLPSVPSRARIGQQPILALSLLCAQAVLLPILLVGCEREPRLPVLTDVTEFTQNPYRDQEKAALEGRRLFLNNCSICHGHEGRGDGPSRSTLIAEPANLTVDPVASYADGRMFLVIRLGKMVDGRLTMPPVEKMADDQIWKTIAYVRTLRTTPAGQLPLTK